jgi:hypothetical protein
MTRLYATGVDIDTADFNLVTSEDVQHFYILEQFF